MEDNCFTMLCWFLCTTWSTVSIHLLPSSWTSLPPPTPGHPSRLSQSAGLSSLYHIATSMTSWKLPCFTHGICVVLLWQFVPPSPSLTVSTNLFSMSVFLEMDIWWSHWCSLRLYPGKREVEREERDTAFIGLEANVDPGFWAFLHKRTPAHSACTLTFC